MKQDPKPVKSGFAGETIKYWREMMRKIEVKVGPNKLIGYFHGIGCCYEEFESGPGNYTVFIVELHDGSVECYTPECCRFLDKPETPEIFPGTNEALSKIKI